MNNSPLLEVKNLTVEFKVDHQTIKVLHDISFTLHNNETLGIVGESGSGKSVTSLSIMGLIPSPPGIISNGEILYHARNSETIDLLKLSNKKLRNYRGKEIAMIFQEPMTSLNPVYTCGNQVVEMILQHQDISKQKAKEKTISLFEEVQLPGPSEIFKSYPHQLSGGQRQRVMIAMAVSCNPSILIADEPTTALDVTIQKKIITLLQNLQAKHNMSLIFITHDLGLIANLADSLIVMYKGKIIEQGNSSEVFNNPKHPYTKGLLACRPPLAFRLNHLPTVSDFMKNDEEKDMSDEQSIKKFLKNFKISDQERTENLKKIYLKKPILELKNIKTFIPTKRNLIGKVTQFVKAVDDVSLSVYPGETLGLVGESGCGKTTLGRTILKLIKSTDGQIIYKGKNITSLSNKELRRLRKDIQIVFQDPYSSLNPRLTIGPAITEPMKIHGLYFNDKERQNKAIDLLKKVDLEESFFYRYPHEFSGGQRQRICIARALALNPQFIICDESVSALDVSVQAQVLNLLNHLKKEFGFTYIFISHDLSVVKFMSDKIIVMKDGKIQEVGEADQLYKNPQTDYTRKLIEAIPI